MVCTTQLTADRRYLVIRNGGPLLALAVVLWNWLGVLGLATYLINGVIGLLQPAKADPAERQDR
jgi:type IV secretory pathway TrbD component